MQRNIRQELPALPIFATGSTNVPRTYTPLSAPHERRNLFVALTHNGIHDSLQFNDDMGATLFKSQHSHDWNATPTDVQSQHDDVNSSLDGPRIHNFTTASCEIHSTSGDTFYI